ncbi:MAG: glycoside hydrolase family 78 protein [Planctomycetes bacterium]|nr:glycoside hydrolase family 78 protein [Planctomycetota bacterium]
MADVAATHLRCEYLVSPLAVDTPQPRLSWEVQSADRGVQQTAYQILAAGSRDALANDRADLWDTGKVASRETAQVIYAGKPLRSGQSVLWKVRLWTDGGGSSAWSQPATWRVGLLDPDVLKAKWIGDPTPPPEGDDLPARPSPMLRKAFRIDKQVQRAVATVSALGLYETRLNGQRVSESLLAPEWTDYHTRVQYQTYDVTTLLRAGDNVVAATLGDGWYAGRIGISQIVGKDAKLRAHYGKRLRFLMQMDVEYADGSSESLITDGTWKATTDGPIRKACILDGEVYDAGREMDGWDYPGFNDAAWTPVDVQDKIDAQLVAQPNEPIRITQEIEARAVAEPRPGVYVFDFGQNLAGWCRIKVRGAAGTTITLRHAEVLDPDGKIYRDNLRMKPLGGQLGARQENQFILRGKGLEIYEPHFTYHGFRFVEVTGLPAKPPLEFITARHFHSNTPPAGEFSCSSPLLNKLMQNTVWTHRDNMHSVPTDCPQRDERMGWMGDMLVFAQPACFNMDMAAFFTKWVRDIRDDQAKDGRYPDFAPHPFDSDARFSGVPAWGDCGVVVPWRMYVNYGDVRVIEQHFDSARRWVDWIHQNNPDLLWKNKRNNDYGDWLNGDTLKLEGFPKGEAEVPKEVFATAFFQHSTELVARMAGVIGRKDEVDKYGKLAENIRQAFVKAYIGGDATVKGNTQSAYALALAFNLMPSDKRAAAVDRMVERIHAYKDHISTGFHTTIMLMSELTRAHRNDVAYMLLNNRTIPSWGYTLDHGGTTIWERWDGYVEGRGYQDPGMNSFCHYAIGSVGEWMYRTILGINPDEVNPGYAHFFLKPVPGGGLTWAKGSYHSIRGRIVSDWKVNGAILTFKTTVPANTRATLHLPATNADSVTEGGKPAAEADGVKFVKMDNGAAIYELASGTYEFVSSGFQK